MPNELLPTNIGFGTVVGRFGSAPLIAGDADGLPDFSPASGLTVTFTPSTAAVIDATATPAPVTIEMVPIVCGLDSQGYLVGGDGQRGVKLIATDDTDINPSGWTYSVTFLRAGAKVAAFRDFSMSLPQGVTKDIALTIPVPSSSGVSLNQAQAAEAAAVAAASAASASAASAQAAASSIAGAVTVDNLGQATTFSKALVKTADAKAARASLAAPLKPAAVVYVDDYIPTGVNKATTDTAAYWALAITAAGDGGTIRCNGAYKINSELQLLNFQTVEGDANFWGSGGGITTNFLDFRSLVANGNGEQVGFRLAAGNSFSRLLLTGPGPTATAAYGVSCVTNPAPVTTSPRFFQVQFYKWTHGVHLYGAYYTVFQDCEWLSNFVGAWLDSCYNMKMVNPRIDARQAGGSAFYTGIQIVNMARGLTILGGAIENYSVGIDVAGGSTLTLNGVYFESLSTGCVGVDCGDGRSNISVRATGCTTYLHHHAYWIKFLHAVYGSLTGHGNKFMYSQWDPSDTVTAPTVPFCYGMSTATSTTINLSGDNLSQCYRVSPYQTWGYTDNIFTQTAIANFNVEFPPTSWDLRSNFSLHGRTPVYPVRTITATGTLLVSDHRVVVNAAGATTQKLPNVTNQVPGRTISLKNIGAGIVTIGTAESSGVTIEGSTTLTTGQSAEFVLYGGNWYTTVSTAAASSSSAVDIQVFNASGTWAKPAGVTTVQVTLIGGGSGGGSGRRGAATTIRGGGGGGGGGGFTSRTLAASACGATETVTVGAGGAGGAAVTVNDTSGNAGVAGGASSFGLHARALASTAGAGGTASSGTAGAGGTGNLLGGAGGTASTTGTLGGNGPTIAGGASGGGAGGGITSTDVPSIGGNGGTVAAVVRSQSAGAAIDTSATPAVAVATDSAEPGSGGGGGGASITTAGGSGAAGAIYGAGGGGGGASLNGNNSGAGGAGAVGIVVVISS